MQLTGALAEEEYRKKDRKSTAPQFLDGD